MNAPANAAPHRAVDTGRTKSSWLRKVGGTGSVTVVAGAGSGGIVVVVMRTVVATDTPRTRRGHSEITEGHRDPVWMRARSQCRRALRPAPIDSKGTLTGVLARAPAATRLVALS